MFGDYDACDSVVAKSDNAVEVAANWLHMYGNTLPYRGSSSATPTAVIRHGAGRPAIRWPDGHVAYIHSSCMPRSGNYHLDLMRRRPVYHYFSSNVESINYWRAVMMSRPYSRRWMDVIARLINNEQPARVGWPGNNPGGVSFYGSLPAGSDGWIYLRGRALARGVTWDDPSDAVSYMVNRFNSGYLSSIAYYSQSASEAADRYHAYWVRGSYSYNGGEGNVYL